VYIRINAKNVPKIVALNLVSTLIDTYFHTSFALQRRIAWDDGEQKESFA
jgi:hypothetical protein